TDEIFPTARDNQRIDIEKQASHQEAERKLLLGGGDSGFISLGENRRNVRQMMVIDRQGLVDEHFAGGGQGNQHAQPSEKHSEIDDTGEEKHLRFGEPDDGRVHAGIFEWDGRNQKDDADGGKDDEGGTAPVSGRQLPEYEFDGAENQQAVEGPFR